MTEPSFVCLYCGHAKLKSEESLEHAVPQFMGGDFAPQQYMLRNVCEQCNNRLGLFVDASYAKSWWVTNGLSIAARRLYTGLIDLPLPMVCMGLSKIHGIVLGEGQVAEHWIGPSGETVIWLRAHDERLFGYSGGNPADKRKKPSTVYFCPTSQDAVRLRMGIASFMNMFKHRKIRKILCAKAVGPSGEEVVPGFDARTEEDEANVGVIMAAINSGSIGCRMGISLKFDRRFLAKISLGVGYSLFGDPYLATTMAEEARKTCWPKDGEPGRVRGSTTLSTPKNVVFSKLIGYPGAVVFSVMNTGPSYALAVTIDQDIPGIVELAPSALSSQFINPEEGYALVLFPSAEKAIEVTVAELVAHSSGGRKVPELQAIDVRIEKAAEFWSQLSPP